MVLESTLNQITKLIRLAALAMLPIVAATAAPLKGVVPVVGSTAGSFGASFRTHVQLHNAGATTVRGSIVFRLQGRAGSPADPALAYELAPRQTKSYADIVTAIGATGLGSLDFYSDDQLPLVTVRAFNDGGSAGTTGVGVPIFTPASALAPGQYSSLVAPADPARQRFNIGVRSLEIGAKIRFILLARTASKRHDSKRTTRRTISSSALPRNSSSLRFPQMTPSVSSF
jgi:hypothetical protein